MASKEYMKAYREKNKDKINAAKTSSKVYGREV